MKKSDLIEVYVYAPNEKYSWGVWMRETEIPEDRKKEFDLLEKIHILKNDWKKLQGLKTPGEFQAYCIE